MRLSIAFAFTLALLAAASGCRREAAPGTTGAAADSPAVASARSPWQQAVDGFIAGWFERNPVSAANAGKHEFDGRLPDWSPAGLKANIAWLHAQRDAVVAFADDELDSVQRFQRDYVLV